MEIINLGKADGLPPVEWNTIVETITAGQAPAPDAAVNSRTTWLSTINEDGSSHVVPVGAIWVDGAFWFQTGATRKAHNVARDPRCSIALSIRGADVVVEGEAQHVTEKDAVTRAAKAWADQGWPAEPDESGTGITAPFNAPSQGPPPWNVYRIEPRSAIVTLNTEPGGLTRFRF